MQNFNHTPAILQFANELVTRSPEMYRMMRHCLLPHLPTEQYLQYVLLLTTTDHTLRMVLCRRQRAKGRRFHTEIGPAVFDAAAAYAKSLGVPDISVAISCDDTKLQPTLRTYWDAEQQHHVLLGAVQGPVIVTGPDELSEVLENMKDPKAKASKVKSSHEVS